MTLSIDNCLPYKRVLELIKEAKEAGIDTSLAPGGVTFYLEHDLEDSRQVLDTICQRYGVQATEGPTRHQQDIIYRTTENSDWRPPER